ncbi:MAG: type II toxin-antitoxin system RelE/ParE family toxin [Methylococcales bacterium]|nr:type II toxin-antitoxin system RelE/ParE family toxin [Methylococcales bacterium]
MIKSFKCKETEKLFNGKCSNKLPQTIQRTAQRNLVLIHAETTLDFLRVPPANRLELLTADRQGQYSIRINEQWRICFIWHENNAFDVEIIDYH